MSQTTAVQTPPAPAPAATNITSALGTNCTVDKCIRCVDPIQITCADCESGWYKKTFKGGNKSYDACWKTWKLALAIIGGLVGLCLLGLCLAYFKRRGLRGRTFCIGQDLKEEVLGSPSEARATYADTPKVIENIGRQNPLPP